MHLCGCSVFEKMRRTSISLSGFRHLQRLRNSPTTFHSDEYTNAQTDSGVESPARSDGGMTTINDHFASALLCAPLNCGKRWSERFHVTAFFFYYKQTDEQTVASCLYLWLRSIVSHPLVPHPQYLPRDLLCFIRLETVPFCLPSHSLRFRIRWTDWTRLYFFRVYCTAAVSCHIISRSRSQDVYATDRRDGRHFLFSRKQLSVRGRSHRRIPDLLPSVCRQLTEFFRNRQDKRREEGMQSVCYRSGCPLFAGFGLL